MSFIADECADPTHVRRVVRAPLCGGCRGATVDPGDVARGTCRRCGGLGFVRKFSVPAVPCPECGGRRS